jgi:hypothetical protein
LCYFDGSRCFGFCKSPNRDIAQIIQNAAVGYAADVLAIERIQAMGMAVGEEVFESVRWEARFAMRWETVTDRGCLLVPRIRVKMHHCHDSRAKDANIRQAMLDRFGPGKEAAMGTKKAPGPLYGVSGDVWSALAIATATYDVCEAHAWNLDRVRELWLKRPVKEGATS